MHACRRQGVRVSRSDGAGCADDSGKDKLMSDGRSKELPCKQRAEMRRMARPTEARSPRYAEVTCQGVIPTGLRLPGDRRWTAEEGARRVELRGTAREQPGAQQAAARRTETD